MLFIFVYSNYIMATPPNTDLNRRGFMSAMTASAAVLLSDVKISDAKPSTQQWTVGQIIDLFLKEVPGAPFPQTVDTLKAGDRDIRVTGIVTTMFATIEVIRKAISLNANFIVAHEPTFYNHLDETGWLGGDQVYQYKAELLKKNKIAVWRNHDYVHRLTADGVMAGVIKQLGWEKFRSNSGGIFTLPSSSLGALVADVKKKLGIPTVRFIGDLSESCDRVLMMPGASGGRNQISAIAREKPDVVFCGEIAEWETAEYVRDARAKGDKLALVVLGHVASEEPGSIFLADWFTQNVKSVKTTHVPAGNSLQFV